MDYSKWNERFVRKFKPRYEGFYWEHVQKHLYKNVMYMLSIYNTILDVGCGDGILPRKFIGYCGYTGVDLSETMIRRAKHKCFRVADATHLPFEDNSFDAVVSIDALEHMSDPLAALREMRRVMRTGGQTIIAVPNERFRNALKRCAGIAPMREDGSSWHLTYMDKERIIAMCNKAKLHPWWVGYSPHALLPMNVIVKCSK